MSLLSSSFLSFEEYFSPGLSFYHRLGFVFCLNHGATLGDSQKGVGEIAACELTVLQRAAEYSCFSWVSFDYRRLGGGLQPISMAVMFPFVLSAVLITLAC